MDFLYSSKAKAYYLSLSLQKTTHILDGKKYHTISRMWSPNDNRLIAPPPCSSSPCTSSESSGNSTIKPDQSVVNVVYSHTHNNKSRTLREIRKRWLGGMMSRVLSTAHRVRCSRPSTSKKTTTAYRVYQWDIDCYNSKLNSHFDSK